MIHSTASAPEKDCVNFFSLCLRFCKVTPPSIIIRAASSSREVFRCVSSTLLRADASFDTTESLPPPDEAADDWWPPKPVGESSGGERGGETSFRIDADRSIFLPV